ncbi:MAG: DNA polymerase I [Planctomycetes bacterium]|nr:DNA polymerase I [Planctomycetota bacterium]
MSDLPKQRTFAAFDDEGPESAARAVPSGPAIPDADPAASTRGGGGGESASGPETGAAPGILAGKTVWVVDSHSLIYQVFHAMREMSSPAGQPVGAVHGFTRDLLDIIGQKRPDYLICAFDHSDVTFRNAIYPRYKEHRESMPDDLRSQFALIDRMLDALGIARIAAPGYEADDILATLARRARDAGGACVLVTNDKDCRQLITDTVRVYNVRKDAMFDGEALRREWGIEPGQVVDYQSLVGDSVDAVPGVPLIGPKMAGELLRQYGSLDGIYARIDELGPSKRKSNLIEFRDQALMSRELVRLRDDVPLELAWDAARVGPVDAGRVGALCGELGFRALSDRIMSLANAGAGGEAEPSGAPIAFRVVDTEGALDALAAELARGRPCSVDLETTSIHPRWAEIVGYAIAVEEGSGWYVPVRAPEGERRLDADRARETLRPALENPAIPKIGQNVKYDLIVLRCHGVALAGIACDTMVADYLLAPGERNHNLDDLARRYLKHETIRIGALIGEGKNRKRMDEVPVERVAEYAVEDAEIPLRLAPRLRRRLHDDGLEPLFDDVEIPLIEVLAEMEFNGIRVDRERLAELSGRFGARIAELGDRIQELAGAPFNMDSPRQLADVLFQRLKLPVVKRTAKSGPSTDAEVLEQLAPLHPLPARMVEYRRLMKLKGTYLDALPELIHPRTGRVHTSFKQDVAATGRLSSKDPNLQNIPVRTREGRSIRTAFLPAEGWSLLTADYSQIELRVLAHFSRDDALLDAFARGEDVHARVAGEVFGVPIGDVTKEMRRRAKAVNFGIVYGQSAFGLARALAIPDDDAARFIDAYFERYPGVQRFMESTLDSCREKGYVGTILGRRRAVSGVRSAAQRGDGRSRTLPERIAINTVIQGSAADLIKLAMIRVHRRLREIPRKSRMLLQIHDELVFEFPPEERSELVRLVDQEMRSAADLAIPLVVDLRTGANWADCDDAAVSE